MFRTIAVIGACTVATAAYYASQLMRYSSEEEKKRSIFGKSINWKSLAFTAVDDRVRGGRSQSHLTVNREGTAAVFHGHLDYTALGGAGFASQFYSKPGSPYNLREFQGLCIETEDGDGKTYAINLKTEHSPKRPDNRNASVVEYKYLFTPGPERQTFFAPFEEFKPYYRGRMLDEDRLVDKSDIKSVSLMASSFFAKQGGDFSVTFVSVSAYKN
ncbi:NADH:ubiquinone oxidoreductase complex I intermediate-associated protein 30 [Basidiobolus meristosporus CBS 931.73]|uniref:NADH:ubiquinone oxidoreductase complex I intermediate-associated protein 30 n=1 Tax=Basidiobolus meristosporus CBS 931.73 TaxID=1314790 RepID=A0A1Y1YEZ8_9FUNG|nr:NADH:ubiquinone oxidoreductase complex I intermediate-associated protein 30 [Basidiobolus meristosporus CBS 931.73]|eukprot:ORX96577.1 NADH:ubiquinone oxidoreductase complex I intermediate-associated protein 30 [Basidiobolus meristosporus CBS 931.73]